VLYGYYIDEIRLAKKDPEVADVAIPYIGERVKFVVINPKRERRQIVARSLGCHAHGACFPHPVMNDAYSTIAGAAQRLALLKPPFDPTLRLDLERFVAQWCEYYVEPLPFDTDLSVESWLPKTAYSAKRQQQLLEAHREVRPKRWRDCKSFIKDEFYVEPKAPRTINSRSDWFKTRVGPIFHAIGEKVFALPFFIKHVPVDERVDHIIEMVAMLASEIDESDFTSFEAHFKKIILSLIPHAVYRKYLAYLIAREVVQQFFYYLEEVIEGDQKLYFTRLIASFIEAEMSGEMSTSLTNSLTNLLLYCWLLNRKYGRPVWEIRGVFEGDDGINSRDPRMRLTKQDFAQVGFDCKMKTSTDLSGTDFCSLIFDEIERIPVTDIIKSYTKFGWGSGVFIHANSTRRLELLRAKSYSLLYQYPGCPVLFELARYGLRVTKQISSLESLFRKSKIPSYTRSIYEAAYAKRHDLEKLRFKECPRTRDLIARRFGLSVPEQRAAESYLRGLSTLQPLMAIHTHHLTPASKEAWDRWVRGVENHDLIRGCAPDLPIIGRVDNFGKNWWARHGEQIILGKQSNRDSRRIVTSGLGIFNLNAA
jgi:hypothetical protein